MRGKTFEPAKDIPDLSGKVILVTGGNAGLGQETVLQLAAHHPSKIYLAARTASKAEAAIAEIKKTVPDAPIEHLPLDLTSFSSIRSAADTFNRVSPRLDILINNAGIMATPYSLTKEGYEIQFGTNHMGHALLTKLLLPTLLKTAEEPNSDVRIVNLSSMGHMMAPKKGLIFDQAALEKEGTWARYGQSKLANILFSRELAQHYPTIKSVAVHPGVILTNLYDDFQTNAFARFAFWILKTIGPFIPGLLLPNVQAGAKNSLWAATAPKADVKSGAYYQPIGILKPGSKFAQNDGLAKKLWEYTETELQKHGE
ncbi:NAD(P)-binding protein [Mytilinidion resinicola]|uniref:NAD(P)-binding protein n=1 Tax=Mytilinidion resinicola TaxID=574789 RepID=A0A6A6YPR7_9PEZI|nr:NAD(P)-binding protein [Mytilinidion resinicola]KAF2809975.1 NAD(P)-binding protein [Mytilinidion resinicola]